jgi:hypothetical protein
MVIASLGALISLAFFVAVFSECVLTFLDTKVVKYLILVTFVASLFGFVIGWLQTFPQISGLILQGTVYFGFAWVVVILLVMVKEIKKEYRKSVGIMTTIVLAIIAGVRLYHRDLVDLLAGIELIIIAG